MAVDLGGDFQDGLRQTLLADAEEQLLEQYAENFVKLVHARLRSYGEANGYDVESTIESFEGVDVERARNGLELTATWGKGEQMERWEFGTDDHTVRGDPLSFVWAAEDDPPQWVREEFDQARSSGGQFQSGWRVFLPEVDVSGIEESRAIRDSLNGLRELLRNA